ncbi:MULTISPECIES: hypothetical protein [unclassified Arthrobacter]|uniref:hypothetical protein n=1 Tax=unclassified Arthrobacter TaxID=235627 RepID=UPI001E4A66B0|nr:MULTISPECIES: hypothetical protein [unclassified Arthrobacter]MCC9144834.1 hypothetical protein [Arthrobacter sp. zg-Y919]MDK1276060.1 hypothetical protein [Arthrobacter sp. zg.Y919]WIB02594.1 hypothetical protein QNO10_11625 [Arthrobacter sp. zg-Y919]
MGPRSSGSAPGTPPRTPPPGIIRAAGAAWLVAGVLVATAGVSFIISARTQHQDSSALTLLGVLALVLAAVSAYSVVRLRSGKRSARETLSSIGIIAGFPFLFRGPALVSVGVVLLACTALLWLPQSNRYFQLRDPKKRRARRGNGS